MKSMLLKSFGYILLILLLTACNEEETSDDFNHPSEEVAFTYYSDLKLGNFEDALELVAPVYLEYIGLTERDFINTFKDRQTLDGWSISTIEIRSSEKVTEDISIAPQLEPLLSEKETYLVIIDLEIESNSETTGVVDHVLVSTDDDGEWKVFGIVSY